jgi:hypothetical protein
MLVDPHGGRLMDRFVRGPQAPALRERARSLTGIDLDARELADLELITTGALSPLAGFLGFTGVSDPYEPPEKPEVLVRTDLETVAETVAKILAALRGLGLCETVGPEAEAVAS